MTNLLKIESKIEKQNVSLDIFVSVTSIARNLHQPGLKKKKKKISYKTKNAFVLYFKNWRTHTLFLVSGSDIGICVAQTSKSKNVWESGPYHRGKKIYCILGRIQAKRGRGWQVWFVP